MAATRERARDGGKLREMAAATAAAVKERGEGGHSNGDHEDEGHGHVNET